MPSRYPKQIENSDYVAIYMGYCITWVIRHGGLGGSRRELFDWFLSKWKFRLRLLMLIQLNLLLNWLISKWRLSGWWILELCRKTVECRMKPCFWHVRWGMYLDGLRQRTQLWKPTKPRARGGCFIRGGYKGKYQIYVKLRFETLDIIFNDFWPQK